MAKRKWTCEICGKVGLWVKSWSWYPCNDGVLAVVCSDECDELLLQAWSKICLWRGPRNIDKARSAAEEEK